MAICLKQSVGLSRAGFKTWKVTRSVSEGIGESSVNRPSLTLRDSFETASRLLIFGVAILISWFDSPILAADPPPKSLDPRIKIELFAEDPVIATPTGIDVDHAGRVWVIESNTHFPPEGYDRHPTDRVHVLTDKDGDGKADDDVIFTDGLKFTMSVAVKPPWFMPGFTKTAEDGGSKIEDGDAKQNPKSKV